LEVRSAGDPDEEDLIFTDLSPAALSDRLQAMGTPVGEDAIRTWLDDADIRQRQIRKDCPVGAIPSGMSNSCVSPSGSKHTKPLATRGFPSTPRPRSSSGRCIAKAEFAAPRPSKRSTTTFPVGLTAW
jgi:hypothetical protein